MRLRVFVAPLTVALLASTASAVDRPSKNTRYDRALRSRTAEPLAQVTARTAVTGTPWAHS